MKISLLKYFTVSLLFAAALAPLSYNSIKSMKLDTSLDGILQVDNQSRDSYEKFNEAFGDKAIVIAVAKINNLFSNEGARTLYDLSEALQEIPDLHDIKSLTHSTRPVRGEFTPADVFAGNFSKMLNFKPFMDPSPKSDTDWQALKEFNTGYPMSSGVLVSPDGNYATVIAVIDRNVNTLEHKKAVMRQAREKAAPFIKEGVTVKFLSEPFLSAEFDELVQQFLWSFIILSLSLMAIVILISFRSFKILFLMLLYQSAGFLVFPIVFEHNLTGTNLFTFVIIPLVSTIQLTFLTHFYSAFQFQASISTDSSCIFRQTMKTVFAPSLTALLTSMIGMGALCLSELEVLRTVGIVGMESLFFIFLITFLPPALFCLKKNNIEEKDAVTAEQHPLLPPLFKQRKMLLMAALLLTVSAAFSWRYIKSDVRADEFLDRKSETRQAITILDKHFGGVAILQLQVETENDNGIQDYETLKYLHNLRKEAETIPGIDSAYTYSQLYSVIHKELVGDELSIGNQLPSKQNCQIYSSLINSFDFPFKHIFENGKRNKTVFFLRTEQLPTDEYLETIRIFERIAQRNTPAGVTVKVDKGIESILKANEKIVKSQVFSAGSSLIFIFICLAVIWRSAKLATAALICNIIPLASILLIMSIADIPMNAITVMVSAIILGISTDDSIHFLNFFDRNKKLLGNTKMAVSATLTHKIMPMVCTSTILIICLLLFLMAPFPPINQFGILGASALFFGLLSSCFLLPAILLLLYSDKK